MKAFKTSLLCIFFVSLSAGGALAQAVAGMGGLTGTVRDASGAAIGAAQVVVTNEAKGIRRSLESNNDGVFAAPALVPAEGYKVTVNKAGFAAYEATNIPIQVGQTVELNVTLGVAATATTVDVTAESPVVDTTKTDVSQVVNSQQIMDLPINGRRV